MRRLGVLGVAVLMLSGHAVADEFIAFKSDSRYAGAGMRVASIELDKHGRLLITGQAGELFVVSPDDVDWDLSRKLSDQMRDEDMAKESARATKQSDRLAAERLKRREQRQLSVLEASELYGVENPSFSVPDAASVRDVARPSTPGPAPAPVPVDSPRLRKIAERLEAANGKRAKFVAELEKLQADNNPDPVSAARRQSLLERRTRELAQADQAIAQILREQEAEEAAERRKAEEAAKPKW